MKIIQPNFLAMVALLIAGQVQAGAICPAEAVGF